MITTWILVSNASTARLFAYSGPKQGLTQIKELSHPQSRLKNAELVSDRAGHMQGSGNGHSSRLPHSEAKQNEACRFAKELAVELNQGRNSQQFGRIILVAPPAFLGLINEKLDAQTSKFVTGRFEKDYTQSDVKALSTHLGL